MKRNNFYYRPSLWDILICFFFLLLSTTSLLIPFVLLQICLDVSTDYLIFVSLVFLTTLPFFLFYGILFLFHAKACMCFYEMDENGIYVGVRKKYLYWEDITGIEIAPYVCGNLKKKYYGNKNKMLVILLNTDGEEMDFTEFGVFSFSLVLYMKKFGKIGEWSASQWITDWMGKEFAIQSPSTELIWIPFDKNVYDYLIGKVVSKYNPKI